jgi:hypothetical protein
MPDRSHFDSGTLFGKSDSKKEMAPVDQTTKPNLRFMWVHTSSLYA